MEWISIAVVAFIAGYFIGHRGAASEVSPSISQDEAGRAEDRAALLHTVRRELGNLLIWADPVKFLNLYRSVHAETSAYRSWKPEALQQKHNEISSKYPQYNDFDVLGVRTYVLYPDARSMLSDDDLAAHYSEITRFVALQAATNENWKFFRPTSNDELEHLEKYLKRITDTKFKLRLQRAIQDFYVWRSGGQQTDAFEYRTHSVHQVPHVAENRYGIHLKDTNEYGLYGFFVYDDGKVSHHYYRSDPSFGLEKWLDVDQEIFEYFGGVRDE